LASPVECVRLDPAAGLVDAAHEGFAAGMDFLQQIEQSSFLVWVRESGSLLGFPTFLFLHTIGLGAVSGLSGVISLRLLGFAPRLPLRALLPFFRLIWIAFYVTAASGLVLLAADARAKLATPVFYVKLLFVALAMVAVQRMRRRIVAASENEAAPLPPDANMLAVASLLFWIAATTAGRLMAYLGPQPGS
jgi:hypothetical protein